MKNIIKIAILSMVLINCSSDDDAVVNNNNDNDTNTTFEPQNIETEVMLKGFSELYPLYSSTDDYLVVHFQQELNSFIGRISFKYYKNEYLQNFDFDQYQLLVVFNIEHSTLFSAGITSITEYENEIKVIVEYLEIDLQSIIENEGDIIVIPNILLFPVEIVKMPKIDKPVEFDTSLI